MATLLSILTDAALYLGKTYADLTISSENLGLVAINHAKRRASLMHDFEFSRKLVDIAVDGVTGGSLASAVLHSDGTTLVDIKSVLEVGIFDEDDNLRPVVWTTVAESLERQRKDNRGNLGWWGRRDDERTSPMGTSRFEFTGTSVFAWPKDATQDYVLGAEVYAFDADWTSVETFGAAVVSGSNDPDFNDNYTPQGTYNNYPLFLSIELTGSRALWSTGTEWRIAAIEDIGTTPTDYYSLATTSASPVGTYTNHGALGGTVEVEDGSAVNDTWVQYAGEYLMWATIEQLNHRFKTFVPRTEGNLAPPSALAAAALDAFIQWDSNMYEQFRRHSR